MKKVLKILLALFLITGSLVLTGCEKEAQNQVIVYNWGEYIDPDLLTKFKEETGITVRYENFVTNEDMYVKLKNGGSKFDVIIPSDYMIEKMIKEGLVQKLDFSQIPNFQGVDKEILYKEYDPKQEYSAPYFWGTLGIVYNKKMVHDPVDSWDILWNPKYQGEILMLDSSRDSLGVALTRLGYSSNSREKAQLEEAKDLLIEQRPLVYAYLVDEMKDIMINEEAQLAVMYSGDALDAIRENPDLAYAVPKEGSNLWFDSMVVSKDAPNYDNAMKWINFMLDPENAALNSEYVGYSTPVLKAKELLPEEMRDDPVAYPDLSKLGHLEVFRDPGDFVTVYDEIWQDIKNH